MLTEQPGDRSGKLYWSYDWYFFSSLQDRDALVKLLTSEAQEDVVKRRVEKKAAVFGQSVTLDGPVQTDANSQANSSLFKVDPSVVYELYGQRVIPLTKQVEVEYLLRRLDWLTDRSRQMCIYPADGFVYP